MTGCSHLNYVWTQVNGPLVCCYDNHLLYTFWVPAGIMPNITPALSVPSVCVCVCASVWRTVCALRRLWGFQSQSLLKEGAFRGSVACHTGNACFSFTVRAGLCIRIVLLLFSDVVRQILLSQPVTDRLLCHLTSLHQRMLRQPYKASFHQCQLALWM